jgi:predicted DNA-binding transcriptional regulator YafY
MSPTVEGVMAKLGRVLPTSLRQRVQAMQETLVMDTLLPDVLVERMVIETLSLAAQQCRQVRLSYRANDDRETERVIDPYGVVCHDGRWYTVGYCHLRSGLRVFRLDRVRQPELQEELFIRPADFHCLEYIIQSFIAIPDTWNVEVVLMIPLEEARRKVPASLASLTLEPQSQGVMLCTSIGDLNRMAQFLVGLGCAFVIHQPIELKTALLELAKTLVQMAQ